MGPSVSRSSVAASGVRGVYQRQQKVFLTKGVVGVRSPRPPQPQIPNHHSLREPTVVRLTSASGALGGRRMNETTEEDFCSRRSRGRRRDDRPDDGSVLPVATSRPGAMVRGHIQQPRSDLVVLMVRDREGPGARPRPGQPDPRCGRATDVTPASAKHRKRPSTRSPTATSTRSSVLQSQHQPPDCSTSFRSTAPYVDPTSRVR